MATNVEKAIKKAYEIQHLNAFITIIDAPSATASKEQKQLADVPFAVKDNIAVAGVPMTCASEQFPERIPEHNAACVDPLLAAGATLIGKTNLDEFAYGSTGEYGAGGPVRNPWNLDRMSGGSSSGSAAAVASGVVPFALGTDTGGSIRIPASLCGVWGFKPSFGSTSLNGVQVLAESMDTLGVVAVSSTWLVRVWHVLSGMSVSTKRDPKIAWLEGPGIPPIDQQVSELTKSFVSPVINTSYEAPWFSNLIEAYAPIRSGEAYATHEHFLTTSPERYRQRMLTLLAEDQSVRAWQYFRAHSTRERLKHDLLQIFEDVDFLALPATPVTAPPIGVSEIEIDGVKVSPHMALLSLTTPWSVLGWPVLCVPAGFIDGLPVGIQIVGPPGSDRELMGMASQLAGTLKIPSTTV